MPLYTVIWDLSTQSSLKKNAPMGLPQASVMEGSSQLRSLFPDDPRLSQDDEALISVENKMVCPRGPTVSVSF